jgi:putative oxidoreductase
MKSMIFKTTKDWTGFIARLTLAIVMFPHAIQHTTGGLGGFGYSGVMGYFTGTLHIPWLFAFLVIAIEVLAPLLLLVGFAGRIAAAALIILMVGIIFSSHFQFGFFMNWLGNQKGEGFEYHLLYIGLCLVVMAGGSGRYSIDGAISET